MKLATTLLAFLFLLSPFVATAAPITYYDSNFEDGGLGGANPAGSIFGTPTNLSTSNLDGRALEFSLNDQIVWERGAAPESNMHYVAFDFWAEPGANITQFLDVPSILRFDLSLTGRHHVDIYYDLISQSIESYLDDVLNSSLITVTAWQPNSVSNTVRIANQASLPGNSTANFQIDNFIWQGNVARAVPEPGTIFILVAGLAGLGFVRRRKT
jgi:hypothetical protein